MTALEPIPRRRVALLTPEGVVLDFSLASVGDRMAALVIDLLLILGGFVLLGVLLAFVIDDASGLVAIGLLLLFLLQNGYFIYFETRRSGTTPGKRRVSIRVIDASGGPLKTESLVARNLTRNLEIWLPLTLMLAPSAMLPQAPVWMALLGAAWIFALALLPLMTQRHLRLGDLAGGTLVVRSPRDSLLSDVSAAPRPAAEQRFAFTPAQLRVYGTYELQVLEGVLRDTGQAHTAKSLTAIAERIAHKIGWEATMSGPEARAFLQAYYDQLRRHLESELLLGRRKKDKFE